MHHRGLSRAVAVLILGAFLGVPDVAPGPARQGVVALHADLPERGEGRGRQPRVGASVRSRAPEAGYDRALAGSPHPPDTTPPPRSSQRPPTLPAPQKIVYSCPSARTCPNYDLVYGTKGWKRDPDGMVRIRFYINPEPPISSPATADQIESAILGATRVWETASPVVHFVYMGRTTRYPIGGDGFSDFALGGTARPTHFDQDGYYTEGDVDKNIQGEYYYAPCQQREGACTPTGVSVEVQDLMTHEIGHVLGLGDLPLGEENSQMTMNGAGEPQDPPAGMRHHTTLALGDILGIRALYPCGGCPLPQIYVP